MKIAIKDYRAVRNVEIELAPLAILAGQNEGGKSSACQAIGSAILGEHGVLPDVKVSEAGALIHSGAARASIEISGPDGTAAISLPHGKLKTTGRPPTASRYALGLLSLFDLDPKDRTRVLLNYLKAEPTKEDLAAALGEFIAADIEVIYKKVLGVGWDGAASETAERGKNFKARWEQATGANYGSTRIQSWSPPGWTGDLDSTSLGSLQQEQTDAQSMLEAAISQSAISGEERTRLQTSAGRIVALTTQVEAQEVTVHDCGRLCDEAQAKRKTLPEPEATVDPHADQRVKLQHVIDDTARPALLESIAKTEARIADLVREIEAAKANRVNLPQPGEITTVPEGTTGFCPGCQSPIMFTHDHKFVHAPTDKSRKAAESSAKQREKQAAALAKADDDIAATKDRLDGARATLASYQQGLKDWDDAQAKLAALPAAPDLEAAREIANQRIKAISQADGDRQRRQNEYDTEQRRLGALESELATAKADRVKLDQQPADAISESDVNAHKEQVRLADLRIHMFTKKGEADRLARSIALNQRIVQALGPKGVRETKLSQAIGEFNGRLAALCKAAGWKTVEFDSDLRVSLAGHEWRMLSTGARYRVQCIIQAALTQLDGSQLIVVDGADVLDSGPAVDGVSKGRPGLLALVEYLGLPCLITMTMKENEARALGAALPVYWLSGGVAELVKAERKAA